MRWRPPTRPLILIALLLLAGAMVNVAVAWGIAAIGPAPSVGVKSISVRASTDGTPRPYAVVIGTRDRAGSDQAAAWRLPMDPPGTVASTVRAGFGYWQCWELDFTDLADKRSVASAAVGFPLPALRASLPDTPPGTRFFARTGGTAPWNPFVPGFLINTLFYTAILALPLSFFPIRRRLRARRGRCAKCGYDLAGLGGAERGAEGGAPCPECGATR